MELLRFTVGKEHFFLLDDAMCINISPLFQGEGREGIAGHLHERSGDCCPASRLQTELLLQL